MQARQQKLCKSTIKCKENNNKYLNMQGNNVVYKYKNESNVN